MRPRRRRLLQMQLYPELMMLRQLPAQEANQLRSSTVQDAFLRLSDREKARLSQQAKRLSDAILQLGIIGALELLAAVGLAIDDADWPQRT